jgi:hypothetical protein
LSKQAATSYSRGALHGQVYQHFRNNGIPI